jgi:DnaJ-class molecular chaperone
MSKFFFEDISGRRISSVGLPIEVKHRPQCHFCKRFFPKQDTRAGYYFCSKCGWLGSLAHELQVGVDVILNPVTCSHCIGGEVTHECAICRTPAAVGIRIDDADSYDLCLKHLAIADRHLKLAERCNDLRSLMILRGAA